ncbi:NUDIX hydrolase [Pseudomonas laurylsulfatiphila]|uniref:DNA mismatch repair protein MutT n=1 Tax=Pseudomonas laurylsulfatiphila TaxID=2011015 RepID=A0A2S6FQ41_9PSED|nr:NUDIX domain-containing protein [Pseudomonas laurylsulfatiphila]PPK39531.1 DNA mismatch repair protein MutT [Pseudomonas laurylsulfatiphila]
MTPNKACPVILLNSSVPRILLFRHPLAGVQLVKGTIESGETPPQAALRELKEESGIAATVVCDMGCWIAQHLDQIWSFQLCEAQVQLPEEWTHYTLDDHGHAFSFFWASLDDLPFTECHPVFYRALMHVKSTLSKGGYLKSPTSIPETTIPDLKAPMML